jgi:site-specific recombinase XerD
LFLRFVAQRHHRTVAQLRLEDLIGAEVGAFLQYIEKERGDSIGTRNCRLAALRSFFSLVAGREPETAEQCAEVLRIPTMRAPLHTPSYLDPPEVEAILAQPDRSTLGGQRDHALLSFLYNTGARIQEALELRPNAIIEYCIR